MSDARTAAWTLLNAARNSSDEDLSRAAIGWAKVNGYTNAATPTPQRVATGERSARGGDGPLVRFGRDKGKPLSEVADLTWYRAALQRDVDSDEPTKVRFREQNLAHLAEVDEAMR